MKVYCKGCKWYEKHSFPAFMPIELCISPKTKKHRDTHYERVYYHPSPKNVNFNNDCKHKEEK